MTLWQRPFWSVGVDAPLELYQQRMVAISCQKSPEPSDRGSGSCHVQNTNTTSCLRTDFNSGPLKDKTQSIRKCSSSVIQPVGLRRSTLQFLLNVAQERVQQGSHTQLQGLPAKKNSANKEWRSVQMKRAVGGECGWPNLLLVLYK